jgi:hypothetical protein
MGKATALPKQAEELQQEVLDPVRTHLPSAISQGPQGYEGTETKITSAKNPHF